MVLAGAVGSFFLFLLLGLLALVVTAALDRTVGKEKALLIYAAAIAVFVFVMRPSAESSGATKPKRLTEIDAPVVGTVDPFAHPPTNPALKRNVFQKYSDTRPLPPITLESPPWVELAFPLPPTIPGPAPAFRRLLRGDLPALTAGDGSSIVEIPEDQFVAYMPTAEDVYDWVMGPGGKPIYIYVRALKPPGAKWVREGAPAFDDLRWRLYRQAEGWEDLTVRFAYVGPEKTASKHLEPMQVFNKAKSNISEKLASDAEAVFLRRSVDNLYRESLEKYGLRLKLENPTLSGLRQAAAEMAEVGKTGKESKEGWRRAVQLLERALELAQGSTPQTRAGILEALIEAYVALRDEASTLRVLAEYANASGNDDYRPWHWLGEFMLEIGLSDAALAYQTKSLDRSRNEAQSLIGAGDALSNTGRHGDALERYDTARADAARLRKAEALLRLGQLDKAKSTIDRVIAGDPSNSRALLVRGAVLYSQGRLDDARKDFEAVAGMENASAERARAAYNLGLTCFRLGQADAAEAAFAACRKSLEFGSSPGPFPDETVSPSLGEALLALGSGQVDKVPAALERARREAPGSAYLEMLAGVVAERQGNTASASRAFEIAQRLAIDYGELDGWLAITYLRLAEQQVTTGADQEAVAETFNRALAFAERAAERERVADPKAFRMQLRLAIIQLRSQQLQPIRKRYEAALASVDDVVIKKIERDQPAAWCLRAYCHYGLGGEVNVSQCIRDFQKVLDDIPEESEGHPWREWRDYAATSLAAVKHWDELEEKTVSFPDTTLPRDWEPDQSQGVKIKVVGGALEFNGSAKGDGAIDDATVTLINGALFRRETFEELSVNVRIPPKRGGSATNNVTFGIQVSSGSRKSQKARTPGIGIFYDKGWIGFRARGGQKKIFEEGQVLREGDGVVKREWPTDEWVQIRIVRLDAERGLMAIYMTTAGDGEVEVFRDFISGFKRSRGKAAFVLSGWSSAREPFDVTVKDIVVVRRKK